MKKLLGILCCVIGTLGSIFMILAGRNKVFFVPSVGFFITDRVQVATMAAVLLLFVLMLILGIRLVRRPKDKRPEEPQRRRHTYDDTTQSPYLKNQPQKELSFIEQERLREWNNLSKLDYVPANGPYLWKYQGKTSGGRGFALEMNGFLIGTIAGVLVFCIGLVYLMQLLGDTQDSKWLSTFLIFGMAGVIGYCALHVGTRANSKQLAFVRTEQGAMYFLDYRSPEFRAYYRDFQIQTAGLSAVSGILVAITYLIQSAVTAKNVRRIDDSQVIEQLMAEGQINVFGKRIRKVQAVEKTATGYRIHCILRQIDGTDFPTSFLLSKSYQHFDELLLNLERLKLDVSYEEELCHICGTRYAGDICPSCGSTNRRRRVNEENWYVKHKSLINVLYWIAGVLVILCLAGCIITYRINKQADYTWQKVTAIVESCDQLSDLEMLNQKKPEVTVRYKNQSYQLKNVTQGSWYYPEGAEKEVFLADGVMYANQEGVTSSGPTAMVYFGFLFGLMGIVTVFVILRFMRKSSRVFGSSF